MLAKVFFVRFFHFCCFFSPIHRFINKKINGFGVISVSIFEDGFVSSDSSKDELFSIQIKLDSISFDYTLSWTRLQLRINFYSYFGCKNTIIDLFIFFLDIKNANVQIIIIRTFHLLPFFAAFAFFETSWMKTCGFFWIFFGFWVFCVIWSAFK